MIVYKYPEEKIVALEFANLLNDEITKSILQKNIVESHDEAVHLSKFFWRMIDESSKGGVQLPCEGSSEYWTEKLYNTIGGYLEKAGYGAEWDDEVDNA